MPAISELIGDEIVDRRYCASLYAPIWLVKALGKSNEVANLPHAAVSRGLSKRFAATSVENAGDVRHGR